MNRNSSSNSSKNSTEIILYLYQKRKLLLLIFIVAAICSVVFTSPVFITPLYKSIAIIYPVKTGSISNALLGDRQDSDILSFGDEVESEQLLQLLNSSLIRDQLFSRYDLQAHYQIDTNAKYKQTKLYNEFKRKFKFSRTEFMAVKIQVMDHDPIFAARLANDIVKLIDTIKTNIQRERAIEGLKIIEDEYLRLSREVELMEDSLTRLREYGVHDYESQAEMINQQLAIELGEGNQAAVKRLEDRLKILAEYGGPYVSLRDDLSFERDRLISLKAKYYEAKIDAEKYLPQSFVVSEAKISEKKSYPPRTIIVLSLTLSVMLFTVLLLFLFEKWSVIKEQL